MGNFSFANNFFSYFLYKHCFCVANKGFLTLRWQSVNKFWLPPSLVCPTKFLCILFLRHCLPLVDKFKSAFNNQVPLFPLFFSTIRLCWKKKVIFKHRICTTGKRYFHHFLTETHFKTIVLD